MGTTWIHKLKESLRLNKNTVGTCQNLTVQEGWKSRGGKTYKQRISLRQYCYNVWTVSKSDNAKRQGDLFSKTEG